MATDLRGLLRHWRARLANDVDSVARPPLEPAFEAHAWHR
jgi:hypothetical protein